MGRVFQIALRDKGKFLSLQCSRGIFLLGGGNLTRSDFDCLENCYLVGGMNLWWGGDKNLLGGSLLEGNISWWEGMSKFSASVAGTPPPSTPSRENPGVKHS